MAFARFSDEQRINDLLAAHKLSVAFLAALAKHAGISRASYPTLATGLSGAGLRTETSQPLLELVRDVDEFVKLFSPVRVELQNAADVYSWIQMAKAGQLKMFVVDEQANNLVERTMVKS